MRLAVLLLIAFAQRLCGAEDVCDGLVSEAVSFVPVVGNVRDLGCGLQKSDAWEVASGVGGLVANVVSFGAYSSAEAAAKVAKAVRAGKKESRWSRQPELPKTGGLLRALRTMQSIGFVGQRASMIAERSL